MFSSLPIATVLEKIVKTPDCDADLVAEIGGLMYGCWQNVHHRAAQFRLYNVC
jgi:hypothetical protein